MTVGELRELLEDLDDGVEVRLQTQPHYPLEYRVAGAALASAVREDAAREREDEAAEEDCVHVPGVEKSTLRAGRCTECSYEVPGTTPPAPEVLYLLEGGQVGYGTKRAWDDRVRC